MEKIKKMLPWADDPNERRIILVGRCQSGKSSTGNIIAGWKAFPVHSTKGGNTVTKQCTICEMKENGKTYRIIDTPGIFDPKMSLADRALEVQSALELAKSGPHCFILILRDDVDSDESRTTIRMMKILFGQAVHKYTVAVFLDQDLYGYKGRTSPRFNFDASERPMSCALADFGMFLNNKSLKNGTLDAKSLLSAIEVISKNGDVVFKESVYISKEVLKLFVGISIDLGKLETEIERRKEGGAISQLRQVQKNMIKPSKKTENERSIILIGKTGNGKSSTGNSILGWECFFSKASGTSVTNGCTMSRGVRRGKSIAVIDTPGLFDAGIPFVDRALQIHNALNLCGSGPHAFLLVLKIGRMSPEEKNAISILKIIFGDTFVEHAMLVFTRKGDLEGQPLDEYINESREISELVGQFQDRCFAIENKSDSKEIDVRQLLNEIEIMTDGGRKYYKADVGVNRAALQRCQGRFKTEDGLITQLNCLTKEISLMKKEMDEKRVKDAVKNMAIGAVAVYGAVYTVPAIAAAGTAVADPAASTGMLQTAMELAEAGATLAWSAGKAFLFR